MSVCVRTKGGWDSAQKSGGPGSPPPILPGRVRCCCYFEVPEPVEEPVPVDDPVAPKPEGAVPLVLVSAPLWVGMPEFCVLLGFGVCVTPGAAPAVLFFVPPVTSCVGPPDMRPDGSCVRISEFCALFVLGERVMPGGRLSGPCAGASAE